MLRSESKPDPVNSALFLLPFLGLFELGMSVYSQGNSLLTPGWRLFPGTFSFIFLGILLIQWFCESSSTDVSDSLFHFDSNRIFRQWRESLWFGMAPALAVLFPGFVLSSMVVNTDVALQLQDGAMQPMTACCAQVGKSGTGMIADKFYQAVSAGLVEEFLFRLLLLSGLLGLLLGLKISRPLSFCLSVLVSSGLFALAHDPHLIAQISHLHFDSLTIQSPGLFSYRFCAGIYLAALYMKRGLGVAVGTHIVYNLTLSCAF